MTDEEWRPVVGYEGLYEVSSVGRVRSLDMKGVDRLGRKYSSPGIIRKLQNGAGGHKTVDLKVAGRRQTRQIHRLMAIAFLPNPEELPFVRHLNDNSWDNRLENLAWGNMSDNLNDSVKNGKHYWAKRDTCSRNHEYTEESSYHNGRQRVCRTCRQEDYGVKEPPNHGTYSGYVSFGCRCQPCRKAASEYRYERSSRART